MTAEPANGVLVVTGGSRGIGAATCVLAARAGWDVAVGYATQRGPALAVCAEVAAAGQRACAVAVDVRDESAVRHLFDRARAELGSIRGLVNNAGIVGRKARLVEMEPDRWRRIFDVNVIGTLLCSREAVRQMSIRDGGAGGAIVNLSSVAATLGSPATYVDYAASKGAIDSFTVGLARELADDGIRVNAVRPGIIDTTIHADSGLPDRSDSAATQVPIGRAGRPEEVAQAVVWLLSDAASYTTGALLDVGGGR